MAHLVWCSRCGKRYRCDIEHPPIGNVFTFMEVEHEDNCPDVLFHIRREVAFNTVSSEKFKTEQEFLAAFNTPIAKMLEDNSLKGAQDCWDDFLIARYKLNQLL